MKRNCSLESVDLTIKENLMVDITITGKYLKSVYKDVKILIEGNSISLEKTGFLHAQTYGIMYLILDKMCDIISSESRTFIHNEEYEYDILLSDRVDRSYITINIFNNLEI